MDLWNGSPSGLNQFRLLTGATYPLLLNGATETGGNVETFYGVYDNYLVLDMSDTTVTYHAALTWPHGNRYHLDEIRAAVDAILSTVDAGPPGLLGPLLRVAPNPVRDHLRIEFLNPSSRATPATIGLHDVSGRSRRVLFEGSVAPGSGTWEGSLAGALGGRPAPGVYLLRLELAGRSLVQRLVVLP